MLKIFIRSFLAILITSTILGYIVFTILMTFTSETNKLIASFAIGLGTPLLIFYISSIKKIGEKTEAEIRTEIQRKHDENIEDHKEIRREVGEKIGEDAFNILSQTNKETHKMVKAIYDEKVDMLIKENEELKAKKSKEDGEDD